MPSVRMLAQVLHSVLNETRYTNRDDLNHDMRSRCARLHVPYDTASIDAAIRMVDGAGRRDDVPPE